MHLKKSILLSSAALLFSTTAYAGDWYGGVYGGINIQSESSNSGETGSFTTGNLGDDTTLDVAAGTDYGWDTEFDNGTVFGAEIGMKYASGLRSGIELSYTTADVDTHTDVTLGGGAIGALDAAAIAGSPTALGVSIADVVADGQGDIQNLSVFANAYYHFAAGDGFSPYVGLGIGFTDSDVEYSPSGIGVIDGGETKLAYQARAGAGFQVSDKIEIFGEYTYRKSDDIEVDNVLFPGTLEIENTQNLLAVGIRAGF